MDSGSQRTFITGRVRDQLSLSRKRMESLHISAFGSSDAQVTIYEAVDLGLCTKDGEMLNFTALVVPFICNPLTSQPINHSREFYDHLCGLELADSAEIGDSIEVDVLIGADVYWSLITGDLRRGSHGPTAISSKVGWILTGPAQQQEAAVNLTLSSTHVLRIDSYPVEQKMDDQLRRFWELESLGIMPEEPSVYEKFTQKISFNGQRYQVSLPWRENHEPLPDNFELCCRRLFSLLKQLQQTPELLVEYDAVIQDQLRKGIVEIVSDLSSVGEGRVHYLPHHGVVRRDKTTSKLRIVYDASARSNGPSLNDCLHTGPNFGQSIFDILLRFRLHNIALAGDIEKAFLMVAVEEKDRDSLRFLWTRDINGEGPELLFLRFARVVFGVTASPFLLNATINFHMEKYRETDPFFVEKFLSAIYVDDVTLSSHDEDSTYELYSKSRTRLAEAGFHLRKFVTNSDQLCTLISSNEQLQENSSPPSKVREEDQSYAKDSLGLKTGDEQNQHKILGVQWDFVEDNLVFDIGNVSRIMSTTEPTKRNVVSMTARFFDPLGVLSPVTVSFKMFFQRLCVSGVDWDEPLTGDLLQEWNHLISALQGPEALVIPRCYLFGLSRSPESMSLVGFCDASLKAYAAVVYLKLESDGLIASRFLAAKTRVSPLRGTTIPRLELLSSLLLSKLMKSVEAALSLEISLGDPVCYTDSRVALYWIQASGREWKQFVENRVTSI